MIRTLVISLFILCYISINAISQIPDGYYDAVEGLTGYALKSELSAIIDGHSSQDYSALWVLYETSDIRSDGKVWDMYSSCDFNFGRASVGGDQDEGSGGNVECDKFNREHTFPRSWFGGDIEPMNSDPFHVVPTDKRVNSVRGSFPYGEVSSASYTSSNGSKLGSNNYPGYSGTVFEPIDEYKGDMARGFFYMATRYQNQIASWENFDASGDAMLNGTSDQVFESWALNMLLEWHALDPVSQKEIDRNEAIYDFQGNRNPFIDHPEYVECIWQTNCGSSVTPIISIDEDLVDFGSIAFGESSAIQSYTISGSDIIDNITIVANNGFEISLTDNAAEFTNYLNLAPSGGSVNATTIYVRLTPESNSNTSVTGELEHSSTGAESKFITVTGSEQEDGVPTINVNVTSIEFGAVPFGESSAVESYLVNGAELTSSLSLSSSDGFEISLTNNEADFTNSLVIDQTNGQVSSTTIFVRFKPIIDDNQMVTGQILHTSSGAENKIVDLSGTELETIIPEINFSFTEATLTENETLTIDLFSDVAFQRDATVAMSFDNLMGLTAEEFTTIPSSSQGISIEWKASQQVNSFDVLFGGGLFESTGDKSVEFVLQPSSDGSYTLGANDRFKVNIIGAIINSLEKPLATFNVFPNPTDGLINIISEDESFDVKVFNFQGRLIYSENAPEIIDLTNHAKGLYTILLQSKETTSSQRILVK